MDDDADQFERVINDVSLINDENNKNMDTYTTGRAFINRINEQETNEIFTVPTPMDAHRNAMKTIDADDNVFNPLKTA